LRVADGVGQHLPQFGLRLGRFTRESGFLPSNHQGYVGMQEEEVNTSRDHKNGQQLPGGGLSAAFRVGCGGV
jgi:hypothetical protein